MGTVYRFLVRQVKAALFAGRNERIPLLVVALGAWIALKLVGAGRGRVYYRRALGPGETVVVRSPASD